MKIKIYEYSTNELLASFPLEQPEQAYAFAKQMEEIGVDIRMDQPSVNHSLGHSLGMSEDELENLSLAIDEEISSHNSCCPETLESTEREPTTEIDSQTIELAEASKVDQSGH